MNHLPYLTTAYDVQIPKIIYGTAWKKDNTANLVEQALRSGFRGIDTACQPKHYNEAGVGEGISAGYDQGIDRSQLYLQTKFTPLNGQDLQNLPYDPNATLNEQVWQSFHTSLHNLKTTFLDCLILHSPLANYQDTLVVWQTMEQIVETGGIRQLGISNCYDAQLLEQLYQDVSIKPAVIQNRFYAQTGYDQTIRSICDEKQIIYQSFWTLTANTDVLAQPALQALATKYQRTIPQVFFRYLTQIEIIPLTGTTSKTHMLEDLAIFDFELTAPECAALKTIIF